MASAVKDHFDRMVGAYRANFSPKRSGNHHAFRRRLNLAADIAATRTGRLLECAVGTGEITLAMLQNGGFSRATLVDLSPEMLKHAQNALAPVSVGVDLTFAEGDIFEYLRAQEDDGGYDCINCLGLIAHTGRLAELLSLFRRRLRPFGAVILQSTLAEQWCVRIRRFFTRRWYSRRHGYQLNYYTSRDIIAAAEQTGFCVEKMVRYSLGVPLGDRVWAAGNHWLENRSERWALSHGAEGLFLLTLKS